MAANDFGFNISVNAVTGASYYQGSLADSTGAVVQNFTSDDANFTVAALPSGARYSLIVYAVKNTTYGRFESGATTQTGTTSR